MSPTAAATVADIPLPVFEPGTIMSTVEASDIVTELLASAGESPGAAITTFVGKAADPSGTEDVAVDVAVLHPADANETVTCWRVALRRRPRRTVLVLSRGGANVLGVTAETAIARTGHRVARDDVDPPEFVLVASGAAVSVALATAGALVEYGHACRVLSVPWPDRFANAGAAPSDVTQVWVDSGTTSPAAVRNALARRRALASPTGGSRTACRTS